MSGPRDSSGMGPPGPQHWHLEAAVPRGTRPGAGGSDTGAGVGALEWHGGMSRWS